MTDEVKNYITPGGFRRLQEELARLWKVERPPVVTTVTWAAGNGDRSENGDYIYGKKKLREIDKRIRFLSKSLDRAVVVDNAGKTHQRVHFGATVTILYEAGDEREVTIVGVDELDSGDARVSWRSPLGRALLTATRRRHGDATRAAWTRTPRDRRGALRRSALATLATTRRHAFCSLPLRRARIGAAGIRQKSSKISASTRLSSRSTRSTNRVELFVKATFRPVLFRFRN